MKSKENEENISLKRKKEFCNIVSFKKKLEESKNFGFYLYANILKTKKIEQLKKQKFDILAIDNKLLENVNDGKRLLFKAYELKKQKNFLIAIKGLESYDKNKLYLELKREDNPIVDIFFPVLYSRESMHHAESGLNQVLLNIMAERIIAIGLDLKELLSEIKKKRYGYLSSIIQNIMFGRKRQINFCLFSFAKSAKEIYDAIDVFHFLLALGASTQQAKSALIFAKAKLDLNKEIFEHKIGNAFIYKDKEKIGIVELLKKLKV